VRLELSKCKLRPWHPSDVEALIRHANNRNIWRNVRDRFPNPYTREAAEDWIRFTTENPQEPNLAIEVAGEAVGGIGLILGQDIDYRSAEIGYWLSEQYWGQGIVTEAVGALTEHAFSAYDLCRIWASVFEWNPASMRVLEKAGFVREGILRKAATKDGQTIDVILYARVRE
jgi:[ribosomal protein S5]-alanine N-acetyltransferase